MCGSSKIPPTVPPVPPSIVIPPEVAEKRDVVKPQGMFDPVTRKYQFRRAGIPQFRIPTSSEQESKTTSGGTVPQ